MITIKVAFNEMGLVNFLLKNGSLSHPISKSSISKIKVEKAGIAPSRFVP